MDANNIIHILPTIYIIYNVTINYPLTCSGVTSAIKIDEIGSAIPKSNPNKNLRISNYVRSDTKAVRSIAINKIKVYRILKENMPKLTLICAQCNQRITRKLKHQ